MKKRSIFEAKISPKILSLIMSGHGGFTTFHFLPTNGPHKLECYNKLSWKVMPGTNTLAYWAHS
jgi:hypothetical protein